MNPFPVPIFSYCYLSLTLLTLHTYFISPSSHSTIFSRHSIEVSTCKKAENYKTARTGNKISFFSFNATLFFISSLLLPALLTAKNTQCFLRIHLLMAILPFSYRQSHHQKTALFSIFFIGSFPLKFFPFSHSQKAKVDSTENHIKLPKSMSIQPAFYTASTTIAKIA